MYRKLFSILTPFSGKFSQYQYIFLLLKSDYMTIDDDDMRW